MCEADLLQVTFSKEVMGRMVNIRDYGKTPKPKNF
jgi:hypothetical protein